MIMKISFFYTILYILKLTTSSTLDLYKNARLGSRIIQTRYGRLQGLIVPLDNYKFLKPIEAYLGVPYATPPTKSNSVVYFICCMYMILMPLVENHNVKRWEKELKKILTTSEKLDKHDNLGRNVCKNCAESITKFYTFHQMYTKSNQKLREMLCQSVDTKTVAIENKPNDYIELNIEDVGSIMQASLEIIDSKWKCSKCSACFHSRSHVNQVHRDDDHASFKTTAGSANIEDENNHSLRWKCTCCLARFKTRDLKNKHQKECRKLNTSTGKNEMTEIYESEFVDYNDFDTSEFHSGDESLGPREFKYESKFGSSDEENDSEINKNCDVATGTLKCKKCSKYFDTQQLLDQHTIDQHQEPKNELLSQENIKQETLDIGEDLYLKTEIEKTEYNTTSTPPKQVRWKCNTCFLVFETRELLRKHRRNHVGARKLPSIVRTGWHCNICDEMFTSRDKVRMHKDMTHPKEKRERKSNEKKNWADVGEYECELCSKTFLSKCKIRKHMDVHKNKNRPKRLCTICGIELCSTYNLNNHIRTVHGRERKFHCTLCDRRFSHSHHLKTHMNRHDGIRPFACQLCVKSFFDKTTLREHVKSVHLNLKAYACRICSRTFNRSGNMRAHMLKTHHLGDLTNVAPTGGNNRQAVDQSASFPPPIYAQHLGETFSTFKEVCSKTEESY